MPILRDSNGKFEGWGYRAGGSPANDAVAYFSTLYHSKYGGPGFLGFDVNGKGDGSGDPEIDSALNKARAETDATKRAGAGARCPAHAREEYVHGPGRARRGNCLPGCLAGSRQLPGLPGRPAHTGFPLVD